MARGNSGRDSTGRGMSWRKAAAAALLVAGAAGVATPAVAATDVRLPTVDAIRAEALRPGNDPIGKPLPLAARWTLNLSPNGQWMYPNIVYHPNRQLDLIEAGHHILPQFPTGHWPYAEDFDFTAMKRAAKLNLPFTMVFYQPEWNLYRDSRFFTLPAGQNPNVVEPGGKVRPQISPFGPVAPWQQVGYAETHTQRIAKLQQLYPNPPLIQWLSNNEPDRLFLSDADQDVRFKNHCPGTCTMAERKAIAAREYKTRYRAMQQGMRDGLDNSAWKGKSIFVGYDAFHWMGVFSYAGEYGISSEHERSQFWDGASPSYYVPDYFQGITDKTVVSPLVGSMSWQMFVDEAIAQRPNFWWEISTWDGGPAVRKRYLAAGESYPVARYQGLIEFGMWVTRPRVVREFQFEEPDLAVADARYMAIVAAVDRVHKNGVLRGFWRQGKLVRHPTQKHPWRIGVPAAYQFKARWFMLDASTNPPYPWVDQEIPVFATALVRGVAPSREWLVLAHSPVRNYSRVQVKVPGYGSITVDTKPSVGFWLVSEAAKTVAAVK